ncbi:MAG: hypothetical protein K9M36_03390 [Candidatus Pacebacteria bacterium]|nr:hypothetical protein [Candidatus Paceibacterota bacterium]
MAEFWNRFLTDRRWFLGTIIIAFFAFLFFWRLIDPAGFTTSINDFFQTIWGIIQSILVLAIVILGIRVILGYKPWWMGGGGKKS